MIANHYIDTSKWMHSDPHFPFGLLWLGQSNEESEMPRSAGDRYACGSCGAQLVYEKPCPCAEGKPHSEICCGSQMTLVQPQASAEQGK